MTIFYLGAGPPVCQSVSMSQDFPERIAITAKDGTRLSAGVIRPAGEPRAVALLGHAMMVNARSLDRPLGAGFASSLAARGFLVVAADLRGHGQSGTPAAQGGDWSYDDLVRLDVPAFIELARGLAPPPTKLCLIGQSLMGHTAAAALGQRPELPVDALVLLSSNFWLRNREPDPRLRLRKELDIAGLALLTNVWGYFPARRLRMGSDDESAAYLKQLIEVYYESRWASADGAVDYRANLANVAVPMLIVVGKGDRYWCTLRSARAFYETARPELVTTWHVGRGDLGLEFDPGHMEVITDRRAAPLWQAIADWIELTLLS